MQKKKTLLVVGCLLIIAAAIAAWYFWGNKSTETTTTPTVTTPTETEEEAPNYDGTYRGNTDVAAGLAGVKVTIVGTKLTGTATYKGNHGGYAVTLPTKITGTVSEAGKITGTVTVSGTQYGIAMRLTGTTTGQVSGTKITAAYSVSGNVGSYSGKITLTKD